MPPTTTTDGWCPILRKARRQAPGHWSSRVAKMANRGSYYSDCWRFRFGQGEGAYLEGGTLHLVTGLVIPLAEGYVPPAVVHDAFPLRAGDGGCLNGAGQVTTLDLSPSY